MTQKELYKQNLRTGDLQYSRQLACNFSHFNMFPPDSEEMVLADILKPRNCDRCNETWETWTLEETNIIGYNTRPLALDI